MARRSREISTVEGTSRKRVDAPIHDRILNDRKADRKLARQAKKRAIEAGLDPKVAKEAYRLR